MAVVEHAVLTALPAGLVPPEVAERAVGDPDARLAQVTAFVTPRIRVDGADVPVADLDAFAVWPDSVDAWGPSLVVDGTPLRGVRHPDLPRPDRQLWARLFERCVVRDRQFTDLSALAMLTVPASDVDDLVGRLYSEHTATAFPSESELAALGDELRAEGVPLRDLPAGDLADSLPGIHRRLDRARENGSAELDVLVLQLAERFYHRPEASRPTPAGRTVAQQLEALEAREPDFDFHQVCAALGDYPLLLRALGLAVDLLVEQAALKQAGWVAVAPVVDGPTQLVDTAAGLPRTRYRHTDGLFVPADRDASPDPGIRRGMLDLRRHRLTTLDVDSAAPQVAQVLANASYRQQVLAEEGSARSKDVSSLPALRTGGITVLRPGRHGVLEESLQRSAAHEATVSTDEPAELWSDDVTRGWRLDVLDEDSGTTRRWLSLGQREGTYVFDGQPLAVGGQEFEAYVKSASASTDTEDPLVLYTSEAVLGWDGWSLAARRPGRVITPDDVAEPRQDPLPAFPLVATFVPARGSLPVLRFGRRYRLRVRATDLAGNSHLLDAAPEGYESDPVLMTRWEPVLPPEVVPQLPFGEGESLLRVVLRSTRDVPADSYVQLDRVRSLPGHPSAPGSGVDWAYQPVAVRHLLPPKEAQLQAERHGGFDAAFGAGDPQALVPLLEREAGTFYDLPGRVLVRQGDPDATVQQPVERGGPLGSHEYLVAPVRPTVPPYLPDHLATAVVVHDLPGRQADDPLRVDLATGTHAWPDHRTAMLRVEEGPLSATLDAATGVLAVRLPKAEVLTIRLTSGLDAATLPLMAVWERVVQAAGSGRQLSAALDDLKAAALAGRLWPLTPWITLTLVHAVERPLEEPELQLPPGTWGLPLADRLGGETFASLVGTVHTHARSTGRVDVDAAWEEPRDDLGRAPTLRREDWVPGSAHVGSLDLRPDEDAAQIGRQDAGGAHAMRHELGDTRHRTVTYRLTATTRFRDYFPPAVTDDRDLITTTSETDVHVPSSRRPEPPQVAYVLPVFGWDEAHYAARRVRGRQWPPAFRRTRRGGGLRIYLRRPWWSSGAGERLAVVLPDQKPPPPQLDLSALLGREADGAAVESVAGALSGLLEQAGVLKATPARLQRAMQRTGPWTADAGQQPLLSALHEAMADAGVEVDRPALERIWGQVGDVIGRPPVILQPASRLDEGERSAFVTRWGRDPAAVAGDPTLSPRIGDLLDRDGYATGLRLPGPHGERVAVATYEPQFDAERDLWFVDLHLAEHDHFLPFVRLALARYQKHAIAGCELSEVRVGDFVQVLPTREVTVRDFGGPTAHVTLRGTAGYGAASYASPGSRAARARAGRSLLVRAWVEQHPAGSTTDLDWEPAAASDSWLPLDELDEHWRARWLGAVPLPTPRRGTAYRLAVEELQVHSTDAQNVERDPQRFGHLPGTRHPVPVGLRLLWADRIDLHAVDGRLTVRTAPG